MPASRWGKYIISDPKFVTDLAFHDFKEVSVGIAKLRPACAGFLMEK